MIKNIVLVDALWVGHHAVYLKLFSKILLEIGYNVVTICPAPVELDQWIRANCSSDDNKRFQSYPYPDILPSKSVFSLLLSVNSVKTWWVTSRLIKDIYKYGQSPDLVFFAWLDTQLDCILPVKVIDFIFPYQWSGIYFHPRRLRGNLGRRPWRRLDFSVNILTKSRKCCCVGLLDKGIVPKLQSKLHGKTVVAFPDIADDSPPDLSYDLSNKIITQARGRKIIGLLGSLEKRKGILSFVEIIKKANREKYFFFLAGELAINTFSKEEYNSIINFCYTQQENFIYFLDKIPTDNRFNSLVNICDLIYTVYDDFRHSSNLITKAALFKKPVIVADCYYMSEVVTKYGLGACAEAGNIKQCLDVIESICSQLDSREDCSGFGYDDYIADNSINYLLESFTKIMNEVSGSD